MNGYHSPENCAEVSHPLPVDLIVIKQFLTRVQRLTSKIIARELIGYYRVGLLTPAFSKPLLEHPEPDSFYPLLKVLHNAGLFRTDTPKRVFKHTKLDCLLRIMGEVYCADLYLSPEAFTAVLEHPELECFSKVLLVLGGGKIAITAALFKRLLEHNDLGLIFIAIQKLRCAKQLTQANVEILVYHAEPAHVAVAVAALAEIDSMLDSAQSISPQFSHHDAR